MLHLLVVALSVAFAVIPMVLGVVVVWWLDRYDREPPSLVALAFGWGAVGATVLGGASTLIVELPLASAVGEADAGAVGAAFLAPFFEETAKGLVLLLIYRSGKFDNVTDGLVYGATAGLGFAMTENFLYFVKTYAEGGLAAWAANVVMRTFFSALMHTVATASFGAGLGYVKFKRYQVRKLLAPCLGLGVAMGIHAAWNGLIVLGERLGSGVPILLALATLLAEFGILAGLLQLSLHLEHRMIVAELAEEASLGVMPAAHARIVPFYLARRRPGWCSLGARTAEYCARATELAFRKWQLRGAKERDLPHLRADVERLRGEVRAMLGTEAPGAAR